MRMKVPDDQAIQSLIAFGARHRMVMAWWLKKNHGWVGVTPGYDHAKPDKNALALEIFAQYMAQLEALEITYFALRDKARKPGRSFLELYQGISINEHWKRARPKTTSYSARRLLAELRGMGVRRFQHELGMPTYEELAAGSCGKPLGKTRPSRLEFHNEIRRHIRWMRDAVANKKHKAMHKAFMKMKHGFPVLGHPESDDVFIVHETKRRTKDMCVATVVPLNNNDEFLEMLVDETKKVGDLVIDLLRLYLRRSPWEPCAECEVCPDRKALPKQEANE